MACSKRSPKLWVAGTALYAPVRDVVLHKMQRWRLQEIRWCPYVNSAGEDVFLIFLKSIRKIRDEMWTAVCKDMDMTICSGDPACLGTEDAVRHRRKSMWKVYLLMLSEKASDDKNVCASRELEENVICRVVSEPVEEDEDESLAQKKPKKGHGSKSVTGQEMCPFGLSQPPVSAPWLGPLDVCKAFFALDEPGQIVDGKPGLLRLIQGIIPGGIIGIPDLEATLPLFRQEYQSYLIDMDDPCSNSLELHRRALNLERMASDLLAVGEEWLTLWQQQDEPGVARASPLTPDEVNDLVYMLLHWGGPGSCGRGLWLSKSVQRLSVPEMAKPERAGMRKVVATLCHVRDGAFTRCYPVIEPLTWGVPLLAVTFNAFYDIYGNAASSVHGGQRVAEWLTIRRRALHKEKQRLCQYGSLLTCVCRRLQHIADKIQPQSESRKVAFLNSVGRPCQGRYLPFIGEMDPDWQLMDKTELKAWMKDLNSEDEDEVRRFMIAVHGEAGGSVYAQWHAVRKTMVRRMYEDSHVLCATACLPPTPSLQSACLDYAQMQLPA